MQEAPADVTIEELQFGLGNVEGLLAHAWKKRLPFVQPPPDMMHPAPQTMADDSCHMLGMCRNKLPIFGHRNDAELIQNNCA